MIKADFPICRGVAGIASIKRLDMIGPFATGDHTVMAVAANAEDKEVVHGYYRHPRQGIVASPAFIGAINVLRRFSRGLEPIVAIDTGLTHHRSMVKADFPIRGAVATIAGALGHDMVGVFSPGDHAVVTVATHTQNKAVIHRDHRTPLHILEGMAGPTIVGAGDMSHRFSSRIDAVVTGYAGTFTNRAMVKRKLPAHGIVALAAGLGGLQVRWPLTRRGYVVVAGFAKLIRHNRVIDQCRGRETRRRVTAIAIRRSGYMHRRYAKRCTIVMAGAAASRQTIKAFVAMAAFAIDNVMIAGQRKSGA